MADPTQPGSKSFDPNPLLVTRFLRMTSPGIEDFTMQMILIHLGLNKINYFFKFFKVRLEIPFCLPDTLPTVVLPMTIRLPCLFAYYH